MMKSNLAVLAARSKRMGDPLHAIGRSIISESHAVGRGTLPGRRQLSALRGCVDENAVLTDRCHGVTHQGRMDDKFSLPHKPIRCQLIVRNDVDVFHGLTLPRVRRAGCET